MDEQHFLFSFDVHTMGCDNIVIMTDFAATLNLRALKTMNSSVNAHAFLDNIIVISNQRTENVKTSNRNSPDVVFQEYQINDYKVYSFIGSTMSRGGG
jgi:hypothetical protein